MSKIPERKRQKVAMFSSWGGWSRSSENIQESRSNDPASEGLHLITLIIVLQLEVIWGWFWIINRSSDTSIKKSRMNREVHVRFCERFRGETPLYLLDFLSVCYFQITFLFRLCFIIDSLKFSCFFYSLNLMYAFCIAYTRQLSAVKVVCWNCQKVKKIQFVPVG